MIDPKLADEFEALMRSQYPRMTNSHGIAFVAEYKEDFEEWLRARKPLMFNEFEEHLRQMSVIKVTHPHFSDIGDGLLEAAQRLAAMREDVARLEWVLPLVTGEPDNPIADVRTRALVRALGRKLDGRDAIDAARKEFP
jgi:hypothetical protein